jgi:CrtC N-terminal lipocalin domain
MNNSTLVAAPATATVAATVQEHLLTVQQAVNAITDPSTGQPVQLPDFSTLYEAAGKLDNSTCAADLMSVITALLGRAGSVDFNAPPDNYQVAFPKDHHLHADMGTEWYWIGCHLNVTDPAGNTGRIALLLSMQKIRAVGLTAQRNAGWTDQQVTVASNVATLTVDMGPDKRGYYRRSRNLQWPLMGGEVAFSAPGEDFYFQCGADSLTGSANVLPLYVNVNDGEYLSVNLELTNGPAFTPETAFFLQGVPTLNGGTGVTPVPTPGIYYSWPQLLVSGSVTVNGITYEVNSGTGWIDHQLMMTSLENPNGEIHPVPFVEDPTPYNGWVWQFYNLDNGQAFTGAGFELGAMNYNPKMTYGYFLNPNNGAWEAFFINGDLALQDPAQFPAITCNTPYQVPDVTIPTARGYSNVENPLLGQPLSGQATPWYTDGTFNTQPWGLCAEFPADFTDTSGNYANGLGFLETVSFAPVEDYRNFALTFLETGVYPCELCAQEQAPPK